MNSGDDFGHRVFGNVVLATIELLLGNEGQAERALPSVMRNGVTDIIDARAIGDLLDNRRLSHAGRPQHDDGPLHSEGNEVETVVVFRKICLDGTLDLLARFLDVHTSSYNLESGIDASLSTICAAHGGARPG